MNTQKPANYFPDAIALLRQLISIPSFSGEERDTAAAIEQHLISRGVATNRFINNIWTFNKYYDRLKPTILLNSHHDTVRPNTGYTNNPFEPLEQDGKLFGLGSNDAGGCLVSLIAAFLHFYERQDLKYNILLAASAEEEISGTNGIEALLPKIGKIEFAIVGEPTKMDMAVAEKGLLVLDCTAQGRSGHAARNEGENAIYKAMKDISWFSDYCFPRESALLGPVSMNVTMVNAGSQHNVVPGTCNFTVDCRINELYSHDDIVETVKQNVNSDVVPRSMRLRSSFIAFDHPLVAAGTKMGRKHFGSPTLSDKALMPFPALKMGPGDSARSHIADEFIYVNEIMEGIELYIQLLNEIL
jgi:acetylornithine deacetylase